MDGAFEITDADGLMPMEVPLHEGLHRPRRRPAVTSAVVMDCERVKILAAEVMEQRAALLRNVAALRGTLGSRAPGA